MLLAYEVTRDLPVKMIEIKTPIERMRAPVVDDKNITLVSILRAGNGLLDGILELIPEARVGHIGLYRDPKTLNPVEYYFKNATEYGHQ
jgi:uracil phosphoribosyltransferase